MSSPCLNVKRCRPPFVFRYYTNLLRRRRRRHCRIVLIQCVLGQLQDEGPTQQPNEMAMK